MARWAEDEKQNTDEPSPLSRGRNENAQLLLTAPTLQHSITPILHHPSPPRFPLRARAVLFRDDLINRVVNLKILVPIRHHKTPRAQQQETKLGDRVLENLIQ